MNPVTKVMPIPLTTELVEALHHAQLVARAYQHVRGGLVTCTSLGLKAQTDVGPWVTLVVNAQTNADKVAVEYAENRGGKHDQLTYEKYYVVAFLLISLCKTKLHEEKDLPRPSWFPYPPTMIGKSIPQSPRNGREVVLRLRGGHPPDMAGRQPQRKTRCCRDDTLNMDLYYQAKAQGYQSLKDQQDELRRRERKVKAPLKGQKLKRKKYKY